MYYGPQRKHLRLESYDYSQHGFYFVTICTKGRLHYFGEIQNEEIILSEMGKIAKQEIKNDIRQNIRIDSYVIMSNHIHAIIVIQNIKTDTVWCDGIAPKTEQPENGINPINGTIQPENGTMQSKNGTMQSFPTLSRVIRGLKGRITSRIQKECEDGHVFTWQKSFYDVIIRNEEQLCKTQQYISNNPKNWDTDSNNI